MNRSLLFGEKTNNPSHNTANQHNNRTVTKRISGQKQLLEHQNKSTYNHLWLKQCCVVDVR